MPPYIEQKLKSKWMKERGFTKEEADGVMELFLTFAEVGREIMEKKILKQKDKIAA